MGKVLLLCFAAVVGVMVVLLVDRYRLEGLRYEIDLLKSEVESRDLERLSRTPGRQA